MARMVPHGERIKELCKLRGMTEKELATRTGWSLRTIQGAVAGENKEDAVLEAIAQVLGVPLGEIVLVWDVDFDSRIETAIDLDRKGRFAEAERIARGLAASQPEGSSEWTRSQMRLAIALDHQTRLDTRKLEDAWALLDRTLSADAPAQGESPDADRDRAWVRYQRGIMARRLAEVLCMRTFGALNAQARAWRDRARADLSAVAADGHELGTSARHHLGVIELAEGQYKRAQETFDACLEERRAERSDPARPRFREAYEHRRLGQVHALNGDRAASAREFAEARSIAQLHGHARLLLEIDDDVALFRF